MSEENPYVIDFREEISAINREMRLLFESQVEVISELPFEKVGSKILVLGSKGGVFANQVKSHFPECDVHATDSLQNLMAVAKASYPEVNFQYAPLTNLKYADGFFDIVFVSHVFTYLSTEQDIHDVLKEVYRVTKKNGNFVMIDADNHSYRGDEILQDLVASYGMVRGGTFYATRIIERTLGDFGFTLKSADKVNLNNKTYAERPEVSRNSISMDRMSALGLIVYMGYYPQTSKLYRTLEKEYLSGRVHFELDYRVLITEKVGLSEEEYNKVFATVPKEESPVTSKEDLVMAHSLSDIKNDVKTAVKLVEEPLRTPILAPVKIASPQVVEFAPAAPALLEKESLASVVESSEKKQPIESAKKQSVSEKKQQEPEESSALEMEFLGEVTKVVHKKKEDRRIKKAEDLTKDIEDVDNAAIKEVGRMLYSSIRGVKLKTILVTSILLPTIQILISAMQIYFKADKYNQKRDFLMVPFIMFAGLAISWSAYLNIVSKKLVKNSTVEMLALFTLMVTLLISIVPVIGSSQFFIFFLNAWLLMIPITFAGVAAGRTILTFVYIGIWTTIIYQASVKFGIHYKMKLPSGGEISLISFITILMGNTLIPFAILFFESGVMGAITAKIPLAIQRLSDLAKGQKELELENFRMSHELSAAKNIQEAGVPSMEELKKLKLCRVSARMIPATEVGGDYYDIMEVDGATIVGVGDVTDHGLKSGMVMLMAQSVLRSLVEVEKRGLQESLRTVNTLLYKNVQQRMSDQRNMTLLLSRIETDKITICGQHESVLIYRAATGQVEEIDTEKLGFPVGLIEDIADSLQEVSVPLQVGDTILFYTDGIVEAENERGDYLGLPLLCKMFKKHGTKDVDAILEGIFQDYRDFVGQTTIYDDATAVVCRVV